MSTVIRKLREGPCLPVTINNNNSNNVHKNNPGGRLAKFVNTIWFYIVILVSYKMGFDFIKDCFKRYPKINYTQKRSGQVCVLTGGARGIGFDIVKILLKLDYTVILGVRNVDGMKTGVEQIRRSGISTGHVTILYLDLKLFQSVRTFADDVLSLSEAKRIDMLINNAGIFQDQYELTEDNLECHFQVNYLSHVLLTNLLLPRIKQTAELKRGQSSCHIINTTSRLHLCAGAIQLDNLTDRKLYVPIQCYCDTKLCQIMHSKIIQTQLENEGVTNVQMFSIHPGEIPSDLWHDVGLLELLFRPLMKAICKTKENAASVILYPALSPSLSDTCGGKYFEIDKVAMPHKQAEEERVREGLWDLSMKLTNKHHTTQQPCMLIDAAAGIQLSCSISH